MKQPSYFSNEEQKKNYKVSRESFFECCNLYFSLPQQLEQYQNRYTAICQLFKTRLYQAPDSISDENNRLSVQFTQLDHLFHTTLTRADQFLELLGEYALKAMPSYMKLELPLTRTKIKKQIHLMETDQPVLNRLSIQTREIKQMMDQLHELLSALEARLRMFVN